MPLRLLPFIHSVLFFALGVTVDEVAIWGAAVAGAVLAAVIDRHVQRQCAKVDQAIERLNVATRRRCHADATSARDGAGA